MAEVKQWITVNGKHIPIMEGESKEDAVKKAMGNKTIIKTTEKKETAKKKTATSDKSKKETKTSNARRVESDEEQKERQIAANKKQADEKNMQYKSNTKDSMKHMTAEEFNKEAKRQGIDISSDDIEEYVESSYGGTKLGDKISKLIDHAPDDMKVGDKPLYRGLYFNGEKEMRDFIERGRVVSRRDGLSWTTDKDIAEVFSKDASDYSVVLVNEDDAKNAISIKGIADTPQSSSEVLYSSSTDFDIMDVEYEGTHAIVYVTESVMSKRKY